MNKSDIDYIIEKLESYKPDNIYNGYNSEREKQDQRVSEVLDSIISEIENDYENGDTPITLKNCPFCGGKAEITFIGKEYSRWDYNGYVKAKCLICQTESRGFFIQGTIKIPLKDTVAGYKAAKCWNTRISEVKQNDTQRSD